MIQTGSYHWAVNGNPFYFFLESEDGSLVALVLFTCISPERKGVFELHCKAFSLSAVLGEFPINPESQASSDKALNEFLWETIQLSLSSLFSAAAFTAIRFLLKLSSAWSLPSSHIFTPVSGSCSVVCPSKFLEIRWKFNEEEFGAVRYPRWNYPLN